MSGVPRKLNQPRERARIGADRARSWVRDFNLRNPYAKSILMAVANYMNEDGAAWPGLTTLSRDTDITEDTIASRLRWCEQIGIATVRKCWVDEHGRRNYEKRGRPTSSEIRFQFDANVDDVDHAARATKGDQPLRGAAAKAHAERGQATTSDDNETGVSNSNDPVFSPRRGGGQTDQSLPPVSPQLAPNQPPPPAVRSLEVKQEGSDGGGVARAREPLISELAFEVAEAIAHTCGFLEPASWPPGWCGAPMRVQAMLDHGWHPEIMLATARAVMARRGANNPPDTIKYFERPFERAHREQAAPFPISTNTTTNAENNNAKPQRGGIAGALARIGQVASDLRRGEGAVSGSGEDAPRLLSDGRSQRS